MESKPDASIELLPHHLLCIHGFEGNGYSGTFVETMARVIASLDDSTIVRIVDRLDPICSACPRQPEGVCLDHALVSTIDRRTLERLQLTIGHEDSWGALKARVARLVAPGDLATNCAGCSWHRFGYCEAGIRRLREQTIDRNRSTDRDGP